MARIKTRQFVKINYEIHTDIDDKILDYQKAYLMRYEQKISKSEACAKVIALGVAQVDYIIEKWKDEKKNYVTPPI